MSITRSLLSHKECDPQTVSREVKMSRIECLSAFVNNDLAGNTFLNIICVCRFMNRTVIPLSQQDTFLILLYC